KFRRITRFFAREPLEGVRRQDRPRPGHRWFPLTGSTSTEKVRACRTADPRSTTGPGKDARDQLHPLAAPHPSQTQQVPEGRIFVPQVVHNGASATQPCDSAVFSARPSWDSRSTLFSGAGTVTEADWA